MILFKTNIHELRRERNISQEILAESVGVRRETISLLERGKYNPSLKLAMEIALFFGKSIEEIFVYVKE